MGNRDSRGGEWQSEFLVVLAISLDSSNTTLLCFTAQCKFKLSGYIGVVEALKKNGFISNLLFLFRMAELTKLTVS